MLRGDGLRDENSKCTIILPVFNEEAVIEQTVQTILGVFAQINVEILLVDDGSIDGTWQKIAALCEKEASVLGLRFSRNFGKESAMLAGLASARGDCVIVMDSDLQHPPEAALEMFYTWRGGDFAIIEGVKRQRQQESLWYKLSAGLFYDFLKKLAAIDLHDASDFKLLDRTVLDVFKRMPERQTFFRAMSSWTGLKMTRHYFEVQPRAAGQTKWSPFALLTLAVDSVAAYSSIPLQMVTIVGMAFLAFALILGIQTIYNKIVGIAMGGFTTVILLLLIIGAVLMISLGVIGVYIAKIYNEVKFRPRYVIADTAGDLPLSETGE
jgi:dolichol-phosphate mannosyltransferase